MHQNGDVGAENQRGRIESGVAPRLTGGLDGPRNAGDVGADGERDAVGQASRERDHLRSGGGDVDLDLGQR